MVRKLYSKTSRPPCFEQQLNAAFERLISRLESILLTDSLLLASHLLRTKGVSYEDIPKWTILKIAASFPFSCEIRIIQALLFAGTEKQSYF